MHKLTPVLFGLVASNWFWPVELSFHGKQFWLRQRDFRAVVAVLCLRGLTCAALSVSLPVWADSEARSVPVSRVL